MCGIAADRRRVRALLIADESALSIGVKHLLDRETRVDWWACVPQEAEAWVAVYRPDVVILSLAQPESEDAVAWLRILRRWPGLRLVRVSPGDNTIWIYQGDAETRLVQDTAGFLAALGAGK